MAPDSPTARHAHEALGLGLLESVYQKCLAYEAQLLTYLKLTNLKLGFLLNWNVPLMKDGIKRMVNNLNRWPTRSVKFF